MHLISKLVDKYSFYSHLTSICRSLDPILGVFTGLFAFYLHETHPKTFREEKDRLIGLVQWKLKTRRELAQRSEESDLNEIIQQFNESNEPNNDKT